MSSKNLIQSDKSHPFLERLQSQGLLYPGSVVQKEQLEKILDQEFIDKDEWQFKRRYLTLKFYIELMGYFITQRGLEPPAFRILKTEEMADHATKKLTKALCSNYKVSYIMSNHDTQALNERSKKIYDSVRLKSAQIAMAQQKILLDEFYFE
jgi:hypothetical protein